MQGSGQLLYRRSGSVRSARGRSLLPSIKLDLTTGQSQVTICERVIKMHFAIMEYSQILLKLHSIVSAPTKSSTDCSRSAEYIRSTRDECFQCQILGFLLSKEDCGHRGALLASMSSIVSLDQRSGKSDRTFQGSGQATAAHLIAAANHDSRPRLVGWLGTLSSSG